MSYRTISYWFDSLAAEPGPRAPLPGDLEVDVAIVGGGFTGLWAAYYLTLADPDCRVAVLERETAGFGASGRNGGWCWAALAGLSHYIERDREGGSALREALKATVDEVGRVCRSEQIEADYHKGGGLMVALNRPQAERMREKLKVQWAQGWTEQEYRWLEPAAVSERLRISANCGGTFLEHSARVHPAKLARGVANAAERRGAAIYEQTEVQSVAPGCVYTSRGRVRAHRIVLGLAGYLCQLPGHERDVLPTYNHMIATEPLSDETWDRIGLAGGEGFGDVSRLLIYAQRTADGRIAIGGRGLGYRYGSAIDPRFERDPGVHRALESTLRALLPELGGAAITHRWGGAMGMPRDFVASVRLDPATGIAVAGGYAGDGVCASNLAGRTLCDLLLERKTTLSELPWTSHRSPRWEPEPLRWLGVRTGVALSASTDRLEQRTGRRSPLREGVLRALGMQATY